MSQPRVEEQEKVIREPMDLVDYYLPRPTRKAAFLLRFNQDQLNQLVDEGRVEIQGDDIVRVGIPEDMLGGFYWKPLNPGHGMDKCKGCGSCG